jgi:hypothetical protein
MGRIMGFVKSKKLIFFLPVFMFVMLFTSLPANAQLIVENSAVSEYIWRGMNMLDGGQPAWQPSITYIAGNSGFDFNVWSSIGLHDRSDNANVTDWDELDLTLSYNRNVSNVNVAAGFFYLNLFNKEDWPDDYSTVYEPFVSATFLDIPFSPYISFNYELNDVDGNDIYIVGGIGKSFAFESGQEYFVGLDIGYYDAEWIAPEGFSGLSNIDLSMSTSMQKGGCNISPRFVLTYVPNEEVNTNRFEIWAGLSFTRELFQKQ